MGNISDCIWNKSGGIGEEIYGSLIRLFYSVNKNEAWRYIGWGSISFWDQEKIS